MKETKKIIFKFCGSEMTVECKMNNDVYCSNCGTKGMWDSDYEDQDRDWINSVVFFCTECRSRVIIQDILPPSNEHDVRLES